MSEIIEYLDHELKQLERFNGTQHICRYRNVGHFVLTHGRLWAPKPKPDNLKWRQERNCYGNSASLCLQTRGKYIYCEGFAKISLFPMLHAWCLTQDGEVVDTTWRELGVEYFGIAIKPDYLAYRLARQEDYGLIDCWQHRWPMLHDKPELWNHPINELKGATQVLCTQYQDQRPTTE